jgi:ComF family protein
MLYPYGGVYKQLLSAYKFGRHRVLARFFAQMFLTAAAGWDALQGKDGWVWVPAPPRPGKIKARGWDQVEHIARVLAREGGVPVAQVLRRLPSLSQKTLNRENRLTNLNGRIIMNDQTAPRNVILFDDVCTTGATLDACATALKQGGAQQVLGMCLFYD